MCSLASLRNDGPGLEVWLDRYAAQEMRTFYTCFFHWDAKVIRSLVKQARREWPVVLELGEKDMADSSVLRMKKRLPAGKFNAPIAEYYEGFHYFGFYHRMKGKPDKIQNEFCRQAVEFFLDVIDRYQGSGANVTDEEIYPRLEPALVKSHLTRERSRYLGSQCKERDAYQCQVCSMRFEEVYGPLGHDFAEAHHKQALATLDPAIPTKLEDLITVCANCHRMLHRMEGKADDIKKLKAILRRNRH